MACAFVLAFFIPDTKPKDDAGIAKDEATDKPSIRLLFKNKAFIFLMVFNFLTLSLIDSVVAFAGNHLVITLGAEASVIGWMNVVAVTPEFIFFIFATKIMNKVGFKRFYIFAVITLILRFVVYALTSNVLFFLLAGALGPIMMGAGIIGNFLYIKRHVANNLTGTAFMINAAILTLGRAIFSMVFGVIYEWFGSFMLFKFSIVFFIIALLILLPTRHFDVIGGPLHVTDVPDGMG